MPKYVIERELPGAGKLSQPELRAISQKSCGVLRSLGPEIQWIVQGDERLFALAAALKGRGLKVEVMQDDQKKEE